MTPRQRTSFFFPAWNGCCHRLGWRMAEGRLELGKRPLNVHAQRVLDTATQMATRAHRAPVLDDLRHAVYVVVLGRDEDTNKLKTSEIDRIVSFFQLMVEEVNIGADLRLSNPDIALREALVVTIRNLKVPQAVIDQVCRKSFAPVYTAPHWDQLPLPNLRALTGILKEMKAAYQQEYMETRA